MLSGYCNLGGVSSQHWHIQSTGRKPTTNNSGLLPRKQYYLASITGEPPEEGEFSQSSTTSSRCPVPLHVVSCEIHSTKHEGGRWRDIESEPERQKKTKGIEFKFLETWEGDGWTNGG